MNNTTDRVMNLTRDHPILGYLRVSGFDPNSLEDPRRVDPSAVTPAEIETGDWRVLHWDSVTGPIVFGVDGDDLTTPARGGFEAAVDFGGYLSTGGEQPIDYADESGLLYEWMEVEPVGTPTGTNRQYTLFVPPETERGLDIEDAAEAVEIVRKYPAYAEVPKPVALALADALGGTIDCHEDDLGQEVIRMESLIRRLVAGVGESTQSADPNIMGKKKIARQVYDRNLDVLNQHVDGAGEE